ncbi:hypothetical protein BLNAU_16850 [Blattamonas nauphoetae]|uniref:Uncharacterized protein n=1 Tax=Blattamonas nauphoetae TaxID=2049346 RepID=A0ABQ9X7Z6_9EUKA|nr:hypothetical protein BLNAU_16850 [Blattamonas nauphoetae]
MDLRGRLPCTWDNDGDIDDGERKEDRRAHSQTRNEEAMPKITTFKRRKTPSEGGQVRPRPLATPAGPSHFVPVEHSDPSNKSLIFKTDRFTSAILDNTSFIHDPAQLDEVILKYVEFLKNLSARFLYGSQDDTLTGDEFYDKNLAAVAEDQEGVLAEDDLVT